MYETEDESFKTVVRFVLPTVFDFSTFSYRNGVEVLLMRNIHGTMREDVYIDDGLAATGVRDLSDVAFALDAMSQTPLGCYYRCVGWTSFTKLVLPDPVKWQNVELVHIYS